MSLSAYYNFLSGKRLKLIFLNVINNLASQFSTLFISLLVVRLISIGIWGDYSKIILLITLLGQIPAWGSRDYLVREFSRAPGSINPVWMKSIVSRSVLLLPVFIFVLFTSYNLSIQSYIILILFLRFLFQSYDSLILYQRNYSLKIILEFSWGLLFALIVVLFKDKLTIITLLLLTAILDLAKATAMVIVMNISFKPNFSFFEIDYLKKSFLFFLLGFTGLIISRIDQVSAALFLESNEIGKYQIIMSFLLIIQASSNFIIQPFLKIIYRLKFTTAKRISLKLFLFGIVIGGIGIICMNYILQFFYHIKIDFLLLLLSYLFVLPIFYYTIYIFSLLKIKRVAFIIKLNIAGALFTFLLSFIIMNIYGKSIYVIFFSSTLIQYVLLIIYTFYGNSKLKHPGDFHDIN